MPTVLEPVRPTERVASLDVLRGFALLGILPVNIQSMAMIQAAYLNPTAYGDLTGTNLAVWLLTHLLADQKFMTLFSVLFGAGVLLVAERAAASGRPVFRLHLRRMFWLLVIGLMHAYLLWSGDILVGYAICGLLAFFLRRFSVRRLLVVGFFLIAVPSALYAFFGWSMAFWPPEARAEMLVLWQPGAEVVAQELEAFRNGWLGQLGLRAEHALQFQTFVFLIWSFWRVTGLMLVGMALWKGGILAAGRSRRFYRLCTVAGFAVGLPMVAWGIQRNFAAGWSLDYSMFMGWQYNYWGSLAVSLGYLGALMLLLQANRLVPLMGRLAAVGRMAFTNYLAQTVVVTFVFYGHGLGLFGSVDRTGQLLVVLAVWFLQLWLSPLWLRTFRYGPVEWLWRALTYGARPAMRAAGG